jgi:hypothetical protein
LFVSPSSTPYPAVGDDAGTVYVITWVPNPAIRGSNSSFDTPGPPKTPPAGLPVRKVEVGQEYSAFNPEKPEF